MFTDKKWSQLLALKSWCTKFSALSTAPEVIPGAEIDYWTTDCIFLVFANSLSKNKEADTQGNRHTDSLKTVNTCQVLSHKNCGIDGGWMAGECVIADSIAGWLRVGGERGFGGRQTWFPDPLLTHARFTLTQDRFSHLWASVSSCMKWE